MESERTITRSEPWKVGRKGPQRREIKWVIKNRYRKDSVPVVEFISLLTKDDHVVQSNHCGREQDTDLKYSSHFLDV